MSDFDKEAEREKLREKYERDKAEREATQRMSDLLLKGATMTNTHCGTCGDPLFQQDGTTFCPSCHGNPDAVEGTNLEPQPAEESPDAAGEGDAGTDRDAAAATEQGDADEETAADEGASAADRAEPPARAGTSPAEETTRQFESDPSATAETGDDRPARASAGADRDARSNRETRSRSHRSASPRDGDVDAAHDSLVAALEKFAAEAAETDDPRYAKECLEAAREASETLDVLR